MSMRDPQVSRDVRPGPVAAVRAFFARIGKVLMAAEEAGEPQYHPDAGQDSRPAQPGSAGPGSPATVGTPDPSGPYGTPHADSRDADPLYAGGSLYGQENDPHDAETGGERDGTQASAPAAGGPAGPAGPPAAPETARGQFRPQGETGNVRLIPARRPASEDAGPDPLAADAGPGPLAGSETQEPAASAGLAAAAPTDTELADAGMVGAAPVSEAAPAGEAAAPAGEAAVSEAAVSEGTVSPDAASEDAAAAGFSDDGWSPQLGPDALASEPAAPGRPEPGAAGPAGQPGPAVAGAGPDVADPGAAAAVAAAAGPEVPAGPEAVLPLPRYDSLSLPSLRARLRNLDAAQLQILLDYERAHAGREAVLTMFANRIAKISDGPS